MNFLLRWLISAVALWITVQLDIGLFMQTPGVLPLLLTALVLGLVNAVVRPLMVLLTLPLTLLTLGLFLLVVNALAIAIVAVLTPLGVTGFWGALVGALVLTVINAVLVRLLAAREPRRA